MSSIKVAFFYVIFFFPQIGVIGQSCYWQQRVQYNIEVELNVDKNCMEGEMQVAYTNHSPDTLDRLFFHLYYNAFQPNSMMDVHSRMIGDPDPRVADKIQHLTKDEMGYQKIREVEQDGKKVSFRIEGTIMEVSLMYPILPGATTTVELEFDAQVPVQIRRTGRDNAEGVRYSMSQWYPKLCEYDEDGWHPNPYVGREFYGVWGDFHVEIEMDKDYFVAAGGTLINDPASQKGRQRKWIYESHDVHDFVWAADPDYVHHTLETEDGIILHFVYQPGEDTYLWEELPDIIYRAFPEIQRRYGKYPFSDYWFIQGGDGGMEYPMATLITGERSLPSLVGVSVHELMHNWYQMVLGTNEARYPWMDEGFTSYATNEIMNYIKQEGLLRGFDPLEDTHAGTMTGYRNFSGTPYEEALSTHADHYKRNQAYGIASYVKGALFLHQLSYIIGQEVLDRTLLKYFDLWKFKHPDDYDFIRVAEKESSMVLDWYLEKWIYTTDVIDYGIDTVTTWKKGTEVILKNVGSMMMPIDLVVTLDNGDQILHNIPLRIMRGEKSNEFVNMKFVLEEDWPWTHPTYHLKLPYALEDIDQIQIDPSNRLADINLTNNLWTAHQ